MKHGYLIFNPTSGMRPKSEASVGGVIRDFIQQGIDIKPSPTEPYGNVIHQVRELLRDSPDLLVTWGGDGTINEVVNGMFGSSVPLGVIPGGTANLFARELNLSPTTSRAISLIAQGKTRTISVGQANHRYFLLMAGIGFDSEVIRNVDWNLKKKFGTLAFGFSIFNTIRNYRYPKFSLRMDGQEQDCTFAVICNAKEYAAYFVLAPEANISDEYFYVCMFKEPGLPSMTRYFLHALRRTHGSLASVEIVRATQIEAWGFETVAVQADGELIGHLPMKFQIHPHSLKVFCP